MTFLGSVMTFPIRSARNTFAPCKQSLSRLLLSYPKEFYLEVRASCSGLSARIADSSEDPGYL